MRRTRSQAGEGRRWTAQTETRRIQKDGNMTEREREREREREASDMR